MKKWASLERGTRGVGTQNTAPADGCQRRSKPRGPELLTFQKNLEILGFR